MDYIQKLNKRYACKKMNNSKIDAEKLNRILTSIRLSPSSYGLQPYQVLIIQDNKIKKDIQPLCNNQPHIVECDTLLIFIAYTKISTEILENYINNVSKIRGIPLEKLLAYKNVISQNLENLKNANSLHHWTSKQTYIALGTALTACALEDIDSCPIEGFNKENIDEYFNLKSLDFHSTVMLAIGNKDEKLDFNFNIPKYRKSEESLFVWKK